MSQSSQKNVQTDLEQKAGAKFSAGHYKEAADLYKQLLKSGDKAEWRRQLALCYLSRAQEMSAKGMPKEAIVLWENYAQQAAAPLVSQDQYILWLIAAKQWPKAFSALDKLTAEQLDRDYPALSEWLGFLLVTGVTELEAHLPQDSALFMHWQAVRAALEAYRSGQAEQTLERLKQLPFRSAFRDLSALLKAAIGQSEQAQRLISKIPVLSPYRPAADALQAHTLQGSPFVDMALRLDESQRRVVAKAKGLSNKQLELLDTLAKQRDHSSDKTRFDLVIKYRELFGDELAKAYCETLLVTYPAGHKVYQKHFAVKDSFNEHRLQALLSERQRDGREAIRQWRRCIDILNSGSPENGRKIALILQHMALRSAPEQAVDLRIESLEYDPSDRDTHGQILEYLAQDEADAAEYEEWLDKALQRFPSDIDFLVRAAKSASRRKAFKKAAKYAEQLLKVDPLNTLAKKLLFASHLAHARRLIKTGKFHLVDKELKAAEQLSIDQKVRRQVDLIRGFYDWAAGDKKQGLQAIAGALLKINGDPVNAQFQGTIEATLMGVPVASLTKQLPAFKDHELSESELRRLIESIEDYEEQLDDRGLLLKALDKIKAPLQKSMKSLHYREETLLDWSQTLEKIEHFALLKQCAKAVVGIWDRPIWSYYRIVADCQGDPLRLDYLGSLRLQTLLDEAHRENDQKAQFKISRFLERALGMRNPFDFGGAPFDEDEDEDFNELDSSAIASLFAALTESDMHRIMDRFQDIMAKMSPEEFIAKNIGKYAGKVEPVKLVTLFMDPNFLSAIAMFEAAKELRIDTGLTFKDIVEFFDNRQSSSLPFPFF